METESNSKYELIQRRYVDIEKVSKYTSLPVKTLHEWADQGKVPSIKIGHCVLFDLHYIDKVMASLKRTNNQEENIVNKITGNIHNSNIQCT